METKGLFAHVLPQAVLARPRAGITPDITAPTRVGMPAQAAGAPPQPPRYTMMDVKTLSLSEGPTGNELNVARGTARAAAPAQSVGTYTGAKEVSSGGCRHASLAWPRCDRMPCRCLPPSHLCGRTWQA
jgi:hypothetical protein